MSSLQEVLSLDFMRYALASGLLMAPLLGILGTFVVLRGMSFFGEAIGHSTIAGVGVALLLGLSPIRDPAPFLATLFALSLLTALAIDRLESRGALKTDTTIAIVYALMVAGGNLLVVRATQGNSNTTMMEALFGSILWVQGTDLVIFAVLLALLAAFIARFRAPLTMLTLQPEYARAIGVRTRAVSLMFLVLLTMSVASSVRLMGAVLVTALVVIPAAAARNISRSLRQMLVLSVLASITAVEGGLIASAASDYPAGSLIIAVSGVMFLGSLLAAPMLRGRAPGGSPSAG